MKNAAKKPWRIKKDNNYKPKISILVPTYNEADIICLKLENLIKVKYPKDLMQIIIVDSNSQDQTINIVSSFIKEHPQYNIQLLTENERKGKSAALNFALKKCEGEVVIVSDADCFWSSDILEKALPFLADPSVGAVSGPKILLNPNQSRITRSEGLYLDSMNLMKLGESKIGSTLFFEGGFSAYKKEALASFDPYNTGSDDCGTIIKFIEDGYRTLLIPEARFYSAFPISWKDKLSVKIRRANQLVRILWKYCHFLLRKNITNSKKVVIQGILLYVVGPLMFVLLAATTVILLFNFPYFAFLFLFFLIPKLRVYLLEVIQSYLLLFISMLTAVFNKKFVVWNKPRDRVLLKEKTLHEYKLV
jgi:cellulose synthase/poly-beta-1,6-N-acetylglucosamine synthase-like glycosyltransferase